MVHTIKTVQLFFSICFLQPNAAPIADFSDGHIGYLMLQASFHYTNVKDPMLKPKTMVAMRLSWFCLLILTLHLIQIRYIIVYVNGLLSFVPKYN